MEELMEACEGLAANITTFNDCDAHSQDSPSDADIQRWVDLFGMSVEEACKEIKDWRADFSRNTINGETWTLLEETMSVRGYDKEAYEYSTSPWYLGKKKQEHRTLVNPSAQYVLKLEGLLDSAQAVQRLAQLERVPEVRKDDNSSALFVVVSGADREKIIQSLHDRGEAHFKPTFVRLTKAAKQLSSTTVYPTLGIDTTLPQFRANVPPYDLPESLPRQKQFPVHYFFYGTLADQDVLGRLLNRDPQSILLSPGRVNSGRLVSWAGKYKGLVNSDPSQYVDGWVYEVASEDDEDALRLYETDRYEVARCTIVRRDVGQENGTCNGALQGLTFLFLDGCMQ